MMLYTKINALPDNLKEEAVHFIDLLLEKKRKSKKGKNAKKPQFGSCRGMFEMAPDFDEPLEDLKEYMY